MEDVKLLPSHEMLSHQINSIMNKITFCSMILISFNLEAHGQTVRHDYEQLYLVVVDRSDTLRKEKKIIQVVHLERKQGKDDGDGWPQLSLAHLYCVDSFRFATVPELQWVNKHKWSSFKDIATITNVEKRLSVSETFQNGKWKIRSEIPNIYYPISFRFVRVKDYF